MQGKGNFNEALGCLLLQHFFLPSRILTLYHPEIAGNNNYFEILNQIKNDRKQFELLKTKLFIPDSLTQFDRIYNLTAFNAAIRNKG